MTFVHHHAPDAIPEADHVCFVIQGDRLLAAADVSTSVRLPTIDALSGWRAVESAPLHVGLVEGLPCWACSVESAAAVPPAGWDWHDTRAVLALMTPAQAHALSCARQLLWWDRRHRYCGVCGTPTVMSGEERARRCPTCSAVFFPTTSPAIIVAVTRGDQLLLAHNHNFRAGVFSLLAGFVDPGETLEQAVVREVREEVGIEVADVRYLASQPWPFPNSLMIGFRARHVSGEIAVDGKEIAEAAWYTRSTLPSIPRVGTIARSIIDGWLNDLPQRGTKTSSLWR